MRCLSGPWPPKRWMRVEPWSSDGGCLASEASTARAMESVARAAWCVLAAPYPLVDKRRPRGRLQWDGTRSLNQGTFLINVGVFTRSLLVSSKHTLEMRRGRGACSPLPPRDQAASRGNGPRTAPGNPRRRPSARGGQALGPRPRVAGAARRRSGAAGRPDRAPKLGRRLVEVGRCAAR